MIVIVTGTNTDVGKTIATASAIAVTTHYAPHLRVGVTKPAQTGVSACTTVELGNWDVGDRGDLAVIRALLPHHTVSLMEAIRYPAPLAPRTAALRAKMPLLSSADYADRILDFAADLDVVFVEGAGGVLVELGEEPDGSSTTLITLAHELRKRRPTEDISVLLVSQPNLGMLNHCDLTTRVLADNNIPVCGILLGTWPQEPDLAMLTNKEDVSRITGIPLVGALPAGVGEDITARRGCVEKNSHLWWTTVPWLHHTRED